MKLKNKYRKRSSDPDLDWLYEDDPSNVLGVSNRSHTRSKKTLWESISYRLRSGLALVICLFIPVFWYVNQQLSALADSPPEIGTRLLENPVPANASPPIIEEAGPVKATNTELADYVKVFKESAYSERFSMAEVSAFYHTGLTIDYLNNLDDGGYLEELTFPAIIVYFETGVTLDYLNQMKEGGYLDIFSYPAIAAFYDSGLPVDFLHELEGKDLLKDLSFTDILVMFESQ